MRTRILKFAIAAALTLTAAGQASAEAGFSTLSGIEAEPMNAADMEAIQGRSIGSGYNPFTGQIETCVLGGLSCTGSNFGNLFLPPPGAGTGEWIIFPNPYPEGSLDNFIWQIVNTPPFYLLQ